MTNFGTQAILTELHEHDARSPRGQRRLRTVRTQSLLTALETFPAGADGWREVSADLLRESARLNRKAFDQARRELVDAKLIEYRPGIHRGDKSRWRITFPVDQPPAGKVSTQSGHLPDSKVSTQSGHLPKVSTQSGDSTTVEGAQTRPGKVTPTTVGTPYADSGPLTSHDAPAAAEPGEPTALEPSALKADGGSLRTTRTGSSGPPAATQTPRHAAPRPPTRAKPPWCGECDERTRIVTVLGATPADDRIARCIRCHPLSAERPGRDDEPARSAWLKPWCGQCDDPHTRWAEVEQPDGTVKLARCPDCGIKR